jgi:2-succinyl-6-hydroxy-2,4-cyclohexadiene-1-carboxylate synthase
LAVETAGSGPSLVLVHGFTQTARCWAPFDERFDRSFTVVRVDAPGHGRSSTVAADIEMGAALLGDTAGRASYLGYSMGGRLVLRLAIDRPDLVERLVLIGATAGIEDPALRQARRADDEALAHHLEEVGVDSFLDEWLAQPLFATLPTAAAHVDERRRNTTAGLATSLRLAGTGAQTPLWDRLRELRMPVLLLTGGIDQKFTTVASEMAERIGANTTVRTVPGAGHAVHLERPVEAAALVNEWLGHT